MVILISGASHTGKTMLAQKLMEKYNYPYLSIDHIKMGLIRSGLLNISVYDDEKITSEVWPVIKEIIKTVIENKQSIIIEGCYIPPNYKEDFNASNLSDIKYICLAFALDYIRLNYDKILANGDIIEQRIKDDITMKELIIDNDNYINDAIKYKNELFVIKENYEKEIKSLIDKL